MMQATFIRFDLTVTFGAFDLLHIDMLGVEKRLVDLFALPNGMALGAILLTHNDLPFVPLRYSIRAVQDKTYEQLVLFGNREMMAIMAVELFMFTLCPRVICGLHKMASNAEFWIVLSKIVEFVSNETASKNDDQHKSNNHQFCLQGHRFF